MGEAHTGGRRSTSAEAGGWLVGVLLAAGVTTFVWGLFAVHAVEAWGPAETEAGRVVDRVEGERQQTVCDFVRNQARRRCATTTHPAYSVIGERDDGSAWVVVGPSVYDATDRARGILDVSTSTVTGRVVALDGDRVDWHTRSSGGLLFGIGAVAFWLLMAGLLAVRARRGDLSSWGRPPVWAAVAVLPGVVAGLAGLWFVTWSRGAGLEVRSSADRFGEFVADPLRLFVEPDDGEADDRWFHDATGAELVVFGPDRLAADHADLPSDSRVVPLVWVAHSRFGERGRIELRLNDGGTIVEAVGCPGSVLAFPGTENDPATKFGFVCFDADAEGDLELVYRTGANLADTVEVDALLLGG